MKKVFLFLLCGFFSLYSIAGSNEKNITKKHSYILKNPFNEYMFPGLTSPYLVYSISAGIQGSATGFRYKQGSLLLENNSLLKGFADSNYIDLNLGEIFDQSGTQAIAWGLGVTHNQRILYDELGNNVAQWNSNTLTITNTLTTGFTAGSVCFTTGNPGILNQNNSNFFWDNTFNHLGIQNSAPKVELSIGTNLGTFVNQKVIEVGSATNNTFVLVGQDSINAQGGLKWLRNATSANAKLTIVTNNTAALTIDQSQNVTAKSQANGDSTQSIATDAWTQANMTSWRLPIYRALGSACIAETYPLDETAASTALVNQRVSWLSIYIPTKRTITGIRFFMTTQGVYTANNYNGVGLYRFGKSGSADTLVLVDSTTNNGNIWKAANNTYSNVNFASTYVANPGLYYIGFIWNNSSSSTTPMLGARTTFTNVAVSNLDFPNGGLYCGFQSTLTILPANRLMSALSPLNAVYYFELY